VTGAAGLVGRRVCDRLGASGATVLAVDRVAMPWPSLGSGTATGVGGVDVVAAQVDVASADLESMFAGAEVVVHLARSMPVDAETRSRARADLDLAGRVLETAARRGVAHVVLVSTAMVYGAWPDNPVPLTEDAPIRPNPDFAFAVHKAELERRALEWRSEQSDTTLSVLRPAVTVATGEPSRAARLLRSVAAIRTGDPDPPSQFLHADDLAEAVVVAVRTRADGVLNVAPDGWMPPETLAALLSTRPRLQVPGVLADSTAALRRRVGLAAGPEGLAPYAVHPWVVANDRLRALGWQASNTNEEAYVLGHEPGPFDQLNAKRRQQLALGAFGLVIVAVAAGVGAGVWRVVRRRRSA